MKKKKNFYEKDRSSHRRPAKGSRAERNEGGGDIWIFGRHAGVAALNNPVRKIKKVLATLNAWREIEPQLTRPCSVSPDIVDARTIEKLLPAGTVHQGVLVYACPLEMGDEDSLIYNVLQRDEIRIVVLDQVTDPHNVGAILRSCAAFGVEALVMHARHSPPETGVIAKSSSGALEVVPVYKVKNLADALRAMQEAGIFCVGLTGNTERTIDEVPEHKKMALVMGAEGKGMRQKTGETCDMLVRLPISDKVESLNVSNAAAVALYALGQKR